MKLLKAFAKISLVASLVFSVSCTKSTPRAESTEAALEAYVKLAFNAKSVEDKKRLLDMSIGEANEWLSSLSDEGFRKQFVENHMVLGSMKTRDKSQDQNGDVSVVYELSFKDGRGPEPLGAKEPGGAMTASPAEYSVKKIAYLTREKDTWKIKATKNIKSLVERKDALEILTPETTNKSSDADAQKK